MITDFELRPILHLVLHAAVPAAVALIWYGDRWFRTWLWMMAGWLIDLDHLLADPIYSPGRCSIGFHPLHTWPAMLVYLGLLIPQRARLIGLGLVIHMALDGIDCVWMHASA